MFTPHTVTVINSYETDDYTVQNAATVLKYVFLDVRKGEAVTASGVQLQHSVKLFVPADVTAYDPETKLAKTYVSPTEYAAAEDKSGLWTLEGPGELAIPCWVTRGEVTAEDYATMRVLHETYRVLSATEYDYGSQAMRHWEVDCA